MFRFQSYPKKDCVWLYHPLMSDLRWLEEITVGMPKSRSAHLDGRKSHYEDMSLEAS